MSDRWDHDVVVVGAGVAGLAAATVLGRSLLRVLVLSGPDRRNSGSPEVHNLPHAEGVPPEVLYTGMERTVTGYGVDIRWEKVDRADLDAGTGTVTVSTSAGPVRARRLLLATGLTDDVPAWVPDGAWGVQVFTCPFCHAYEHRGTDFVVVGRGVVAVETGLLCMPHASEVTVLVSEPDAVDSPAADRVRALGGAVVADTVRSAVVDAGVLRLSTAGGSTYGAGAVLLSQIKKPAAGIITAPGLRTTAQGTPECTGEGRTSHPLVWAAGNAASPAHLLAEAMASGVRAGMGLVKDLTFEGLY